MSNCVKINFREKEYIGYVKSISSEWETARTYGNGVSIQNEKFYLRYYNVCLYDKDTFCEIDGIIIFNLSEIKPYEVEDE